MLCDQFFPQQFQQCWSELIKVLDDPMVVWQVLLDAVVLNTYPDHLDSRFPHPLDSGLSDRAIAGVANGTYIFCLPGSPGACKDAWGGILKWQLDNRHRPCNFVELMPRLREK